VVLDEEGAPVKAAKYTGLHALRHFYASWCINRVVDGGLELPGKVVQERLGHSSIVMTMDVYGHLWTSCEAHSWRGHYRLARAFAVNPARLKARALTGKGIDCSARPSKRGCHAKNAAKRLAQGGTNRVVCY
jgi:hypothetical protein